MAHQAEHVSNDPISYFLQTGDEGSKLRVADVLLRADEDPKEVFAKLIRFGTNSKWSHSAIFYLIDDPKKGFDNTYLIEAETKGVRIQSWRNEVIPFEQFNVGIKRVPLDWYVETPYERSRHDPHDSEDIHGIGYLRHVRGIAFDHLNGLYDHKTVLELTALYAQRAAERHLGGIPLIADTAGAIAELFKKWDESESRSVSVLKFICSGIMQYSYFEALRRRIAMGMKVPEDREAAEHNLQQMQRIIFRPDPKGLIQKYIENVQSGELDIQKPAPEDVLDLLKTATPADFNNSDKLEWRYVILKGSIWSIKKAPDSYQPASEDEARALDQITSEHRSNVPKK